mgnify:CR=1 FL=1
MIIVLGEVVVEAGAVEHVREALVEMQSATRKEAGCASYSFAVEVGDSTRIHIAERWESMQALEAHFASPHMAAFGAAVVAVQPKSMDVKAYEVAGEVALPG